MVEESSLAAGAVTKGPVFAVGGLEHPVSARVNRSAVSACAARGRMWVFMVAHSFGTRLEIASECSSATRDTG